MQSSKQFFIIVILFSGFLFPFGCRKEIIRPKKPQLLIIGMDGLEPRVLNDLLHQHKLPNFQRLLEAGSFAKITCVVGMTSPVVWTSIATGVPPEVHGVTGFTVENVPVTSTLRRVPAFWNILSKQKISVATFGWLASWPAEKDGGIMVTDRALFENLESSVFPPGVVDTAHLPPPEKDFLAKFTPYPFNPSYESLKKTDPQYAANFLLDHRLMDIYKRDWAYTNMARRVLKEKDPDVLAVYLQGADYVGHGFWKYYEPEPFRKEGWKIEESEIDYFKDIIPRYYIFLDSLLGKLLRNARKDSTIILLSDHGFGPGLGLFAVQAGDFLSGNHRPQATLILSGTNIRHGVLQTGMITHLDILPTILFNLELPLARDQYGYPLLDYFTDEFLNNSKIKLVQSYGPPKGKGAVERSRTDEEILHELRSLGYIQ